MKLLIINILIFFIILTGQTYSQISFTISTMGYYDDNILRSNNKSGSFLSSTMLGTAYDLENEQSLLKISYNANLSYFNNIPERNYNQHAFLTDYTVLPDSIGTNLNIGGGYSFRSDKEIYNIYDENNIGLYSNIKLDFSENISGIGGYSFNFINYPNLPELSYIEHIFNFSSNFTLPSKTVFIFEANVGLKNYTENIYSTALVFDTLTFPGKGMLNGKGMRTSWNGNTIITGNRMKTEIKNNLTSQLLLSNRISQSISDNTGIQFTYSWRYSLKNNDRFIYSGNFFTSDDELFDDHYGYEGHEFNLGLTQLLPFGMILKLDGEYLFKNYTNNYNSDLSDDPLSIERNDKKFIAFLNLKKSFYIYENIFNPLYLSLSYSYQSNRSTVDYYNYTSNSVFLNLSTAINF